jgi:hypothetical protein
MKNIFKTALLMVCALCLFTACNDDNDSNPKLGGPYEMTLYAPQMAQYDIDLAQSQNLELVCTYPNYGFPTTVNYTVEIATNEGMTDAIEVGSFSSPTMSVPTKDIAIALTTLMMDQDMTEEDFPMELPAYIRVVARMVSADKLTLIESSRVVSNVVKLNNVKLEFSLPPVLPPTEMYIIGDFCGNNWDNGLKMVPVYDNPDMLWHMVYIDANGIKLNETQTDDGAIGFDDVNVTGSLAGDIVSKDGRIASSNPGWYLAVLKTEVVGRDRSYTLEVRPPEVWLMGTVTPGGAWAEFEDGCMFEVPSEANGEFVSPAFANESADDSGVRAYVKVGDGIDWWKSEFRVADNKIDYRGAGGDQDRIKGLAGQKMYLNFTKDEGRIE